jgi:hypothetical protein
MISTLHGDFVLLGSDKTLIRSLCETDRIHDKKEWLAERVNNALDRSELQRHKLIAWKEPDSHIILLHMMVHKNQIKYLHVMRGGLDMTFSANQQLLLLWGEHF